MDGQNFSLSNRTLPPVGAKFSKPYKKTKSWGRIYTFFSYKQVLYKHAQAEIMNILSTL